MSLSQAHVLVTGGAGFIGSHFVELLLECFPDIRVTTLDNLTYAGSMDNLDKVMNNPRHQFMYGNILDENVINKVMADVQWVFHFAAETHVDRSLYNPYRFLETDVIGTFRLLECARHLDDFECFVHVSTDEVYGSLPQGHAHEWAPLAPTSPYSASKAAADRLAAAYFTTYHLPVMIVRPCNAFGPRQYPEKFIPFFITRALDDLVLPLYGDGQNVREWIFVTDLVDAIMCVAQKGTPGEVYNITASNPRTNLEVARLILQILGKSESLIRFVEDRPGHDQRYALDGSRLAGLGWSPKVPFEEGLRTTLAWYQAHPKRWRTQRDKDREFRRFFDQHYASRLQSTSEDTGKTNDSK